MPTSKDQASCYHQSWKKNDGKATVPVVLKPKQVCAAQVVFQSTGRIPRATVWKADEQ